MISAGSPTQARGPLARWMDENSARLYLSVVTVAEIEAGIAKSAREGATRKASLLKDWLDALLWLYVSRVISFDVPIARIAGALSDRARGRGHTSDFADVAIAATAKHHGYAVLTRNVRHFDVLGVPAHDPFATLPPA